jgi:PKD repeat protein
MGGFPNDQAVIAKIIPATYFAPFALYEFSISDLTVYFEDLSAIINEIQIDSWLWDFGDGSSSFLQSPSHTYDSAGIYEARLIVTDIYGQESEAHIENINLEIGLLGDVNGDGIINILDIVITANFVLGNISPSPDEFFASDLNGDGVLNILDIVTLANLILGT